MVKTNPANEPVYFYLSNEWYKGNMPTFYDSENWDLTAFLKENYSKLKEEIVGFYSNRGDEMQSNFTPYNYSEKGWKTLNLYTYGLRYKENCKKFPVLDSIVSQIPGLTMAQIAASHLILDGSRMYFLVLIYRFVVSRRVPGLRK